MSNYLCDFTWLRRAQYGIGIFAVSQCHIYHAPYIIIK
jgi:hypothetical protein